jgi:methyltransferase-like protein/SAM-dependent methyltransferase
MSPQPIDRCTVLELGCADGGNLITMAELLPGSTLLGVDLSARQIAQGEQTLRALGLENVILRKASILDLPNDLGPFDYILCHGVYSWVPANVREQILRFCRQNLAEQGVAYLSYNTYPGWHGREAVRRMMRFHVRNTKNPQEAIASARDLLAFLLEAVPAEREAYHGLLEEEHARLDRVRDTYVFHEHLEDVNEPVYFHEFATVAASHGLQFLADAELVSAIALALPAGVQKALESFGGDRIGREQYLDFLTNRMFRQSLLCKSEVRLHSEPRADALRQLHVASNAKCTSASLDLRSSRAEEFRAGGPVGATTSHTISKAALVCLAEVWPRSIPFAELGELARARVVGNNVIVQDQAEHERDDRLLADNLLRAHAADVVELHSWPPPLAGMPGQFPRASAMARTQAQTGPWVTNAYHQIVNLHPMSCRLLSLLDGRRDRAAIVEELASAVTSEEVKMERFGRAVTEPNRVRGLLRRELDGNLASLARSALLLDDSCAPENCQ